MSSKIIYHMANEADWRAAQEKGSYTGSPDDLRDGFIHFSTGKQVKGSAAKHRAGQRGLLLITVETASLGDDVKWEGADPANPFPHLYRSLNVHEAQAVTPLPLGDDGLHQFPALED